MKSITIYPENEGHLQSLSAFAKQLRLKFVIEGKDAVHSLRKGLIQEFKKECKKYPDFVPDKKLFLAFFEQVLTQLDEKKLKNLVFSLTDSKSIYFRFSLDNGKENDVHLAIYPCADADLEEEDEIEAVLNIYEEKQIILSQFGDLEKMLAFIQQTENTSSENAA